MQRKLSAPALDFDAIRTELGIAEDYGADALAEAEHPVDRFADDRADHTDIPLVTIDPPTSMDLDQAVRIDTDGDGFVVDYAIADVAALVVPEGPLDQESRRRGATIYFPDRSVPLHPRALSEGAGSLLPEQIRPAVLWTIRVSADGLPTDVRVRRARVRSVARLDYVGVSADADAGTLHPSIAALPDFGILRERVGLERGAVELELPEQEVVRDRDGAWTVRQAPRTPADAWNSQLSLLTGMSAGQIMADAGVGVLRTLPPASSQALADLRAVVAGLGITWPAEQGVGVFLAGLPHDDPTTLAVMSAAGALLRGADYLALGVDGQPMPDDPDRLRHAAIGGVYAHVTAPLRRLGDRFATEVCLAVISGAAVPDWVTRAVPTLPAVLRSADSLGATADRRSVDLAESVILADRVGERFDAVVVRPATDKRDAQVFLGEPAVIAPCAGNPPQGVPVSVVLESVDPVAGKVAFRLADS
ncbi:RNB domain-containing ribonuclease [Gordonia soli]|uniref:Putative ribonuclease n=1 Tax=Gordonia soli NBRC 108243 TaxID=1223545 RepID=M0QMG1_9ACTN|nr:RNB domain-containing ribonuclease [Gordonia soli]GAC69466.1 putative ribonuclease [Gordonia soli NBRC 108243]